MSNNVKPPRCPECGKVLYRTMKPKEKRMTILYPFCRNGSCKLHGDIRNAGYYPGNPGKPAKKRRSSSKAKTVPRTDVATPVKGKVAPKRKHRRSAVTASQAAKGKRPPKPTKKSATTKPLPLCERCGEVIERCTCEHRSIVSTRKQIGKAILDAKTRSVTAMSIVVMLQELGEDDVANIMIDRYDLKLYGLKKR